MTVHNFYENSKSKITKSVAFTGYRTQKLSFGSDLTHPDAINLKIALSKEYEKLIINGFKYFYTGGALGSDLMAAEVILELKKRHIDLELQHILCLPCQNHCDRWSEENIRRLEKIKNESTVFYVSDRNYFTGCMQIRNRFMIDSSAIVIAVYDGQNGGTKSTIEYARKKQRKLIIIRPHDPIRIEFFETLSDFFDES